MASKFIAAKLLAIENNINLQSMDDNSVRFNHVIIWTFEITGKLHNII